MNEEDEITAAVLTRRLIAETVAQINGVTAINLFLTNTEAPDTMDSIIDQLLSESSRHSLHARLYDLEASYRVSPNAVDIYNILGLCQSFRLTGMLDLLHAFKLAPSEKGIADMRALLSTKQQRRLSGMPISPIGSCILTDRLAEVRSMAEPRASFDQFVRTNESVPRFDAMCTKQPQSDTTL